MKIIRLFFVVVVGFIGVIVAPAAAWIPSCGMVSDAWTCYDCCDKEVQCWGGPYYSPNCLSEMKACYRDCSDFFGYPEI